jgi:hypothetical protein
VLVCTSNVCSPAVLADDVADHFSIEFSPCVRLENLADLQRRNFFEMDVVPKQLHYEWRFPSRLDPMQHGECCTDWSSYPCPLAAICVQTISCLTPSRSEVGNAELAVPYPIGERKQWRARMLNSRVEILIVDPANG